MQTNKGRVIIGMSGGVDSAVTGLILKQQGYDCIACFMKNWPSDQDNCPSSVDYQDVIKVCEHLKIPYYSLEFIKEYRETVFDIFKKGLLAGVTPNPDILCNKEIKFKAFLNKALELDADFIATGHYAGISPNFELTCAKDSSKDQTYFLYTLKKDILKKVLFPLSNLYKKEVREIAKQFNIPNQSKKDSMGICFIGEKKFRKFISKHLKNTPGNFITKDKKVVGTHQGIHLYTIGQRQGLGLGGEGKPWYVINKNIKDNTITVSRGEDPDLYSNYLVADNLTWVNDPPHKKKLQAKIRHGQKLTDCEVLSLDDRLTLYFPSPQRAIAIGQSVVLYDENICLGGGIIANSRL